MFGSSASVPTSDDATEERIRPNDVREIRATALVPVLLVNF